MIRLLTTIMNEPRTTAAKCRWSGAFLFSLASIRICLSPCREQDDEAADANVGIDDIFEYTIGEVAEEISAESRADGHAADAIEIVDAHSRGHKAVIGTHEGHDDVATEHIDLCHRHILVLVLRCGDEVEHGGRPLHVEETTHQAAEHAGADLCGQGRAQPYLLVEEPKVDAEQDEHYAKHIAQHHIVDLLQTKDRQRGDDDEGTEDRHDAVPLYIAVHADGNIDGVAHGQQPRERGSLGIGGHEKGQHGHDEDAEAKARCALDEARHDAQEKDGKKDGHREKYEMVGTVVQRYTISWIFVWHVGEIVSISDAIWIIVVSLDNFGVLILRF